MKERIKEKGGSYHQLNGTGIVEKQIKPKTINSGWLADLANILGLG